MSSPGSDAVAAAAERLLPGAHLVSTSARPWLRDVTTDTGRYSVRQLDPRFSAVRVDLVHEFLSQPDLLHATRLVAHDRTGPLAFDVREWATGDIHGDAIVEGEWKTLHLPVELELDELGSIAAALAAFHRSGLNASIVARAPHLKLRDTIAGARRSLDLGERRLAGEIRKESRARRWLASSRPLLTNAELALEQAGYLRDEQPVIAHQNLWSAHIVAGESNRFAFLDCATIGAAPAVADLAQLLARGGEWSDERIERAISRYADEFPLAPVQRRLLPWLTVLDAIPSCGQLLVRAHDERTPLTDADRRTVFAAADLQLTLLATLAARFVPPATRQRFRPGRRSRSGAR